MPPLSQETVSVTVTPAAVKSVKNGHPWIYAESIIRANREGNPGDIAVIYNQKREYTAIGLYDPASPIRIRVLHRGRQTSIDEDWLRRRIEDSIAKRTDLADDESTTGYRLIHGENDGLPGLVADVYGAVLVIKLDTAAWIRHLNIIKAIMTELTAPETIVLRLSRTIEDTPETYDGQIIYGKDITKPVVFSENGILFEADPVNGQKTGFFLDQRENRALVKTLCRGKDVLNVFSYNGGFSLYAASGGAKSVISLDIAREALTASERNFALNPSLSKCRHEILCGDAFEHMKLLADRGRKFDVVIVDPPSFARKQQDVPQALKAYEKLAKLAVSLTAKGGMMACASCSARVPAEDFFDTVLKAVKKSGRNHKETDRTQHASDHPIGFPEGAYLKCIYIRL
ncbi:MAG: class I SAM-dependent rRNA methyltransferase [Deferribacterales bacterium]